MVLFFKAIHRFNIIQFKFPWAFFTDLKKILKMYMGAQEIKNSQRNLDGRDCCVGSITMCNFVL